jgi:hypothetical protein
LYTELYHGLDGMAIPEGVSCQLSRRDGPARASCRPCRPGFSLSCLLHRTLPSPNAIAKPLVCGLPKIIGADAIFASRREA